jgi:excisionase family DNA binding protein
MNNTNDTPAWLTAEEMADRLGCSTQTIRKMAKHGTIPCIMIGPIFKFDPDAVEAALVVHR